MILPVYIIVHISQWHQNIRQCEPMLFYTVVCTVYLKSQKKNSIFISVYLIERRPTGEASGETLQISVCFIRMCFSFSFIFAKMNRYLYILGVFSVLVTLLHLCPPPRFSRLPFLHPFFFLLLHALYKHATSVLAYVTSPPSGQRRGSTLVRFHAFKIYFHVLCFVHTYVLINLMYYFGKNGFFVFLTPQKARGTSLTRG